MKVILKSVLLFCIAFAFFSCEEILNAPGSMTVEIDSFLNSDDVNHYLLILEDTHDNLVEKTTSSNSVVFNDLEPGTYGVTVQAYNSLEDILAEGRNSGFLKPGGYMTVKVKEKPPIPENPEPEINVRVDSTNIPYGSSYSFGRINEGECGESITFTIENTGTGPLILSGNPKVVTSESDTEYFKIDQDTLASSIDPGSHSTFTITFYPKLEGKRIATITIENNDENENQYEFDIIGSGNDKRTNTVEYTSAGSYSFLVNDNAVYAIAASIRVVGGGGGGGGGAGQVIYETDYLLDVTHNYNVIVGSGGAGGNTYHLDYGGEPGGASAFEDITAIPGKGGCYYGGDGYPSGKDDLGGSGGNNGSGYGSGGRGGGNVDGHGEPGSRGGSGAVIIEYTYYVEVD
jgi:hypothetical protein